MLVWRRNHTTDMTTTRTESARQSDRVAFRMPIEASWLDSRGVVVQEQAVTLLISRNGGVIRLQERLHQGQELTLKRTIEDGALSKTARARDSPLAKCVWIFSIATVASSTRIPIASAMPPSRIFSAIRPA